MKIKILEVDSEELIRGIIREGSKTEIPSLRDGWLFNFNRHIQLKGKKTFVLVKEDTPRIIEGCLIFSLHETFGPYMDYLEVAPHNKGRNGKYKKVAGCLIAYACVLSFETGIGSDKGILTFYAFGEDENSQRRLEELYRTKYKAIKNIWGFMEIYQNESKLLIEEYLNTKED
ncbi:hypothetical protein D3C71_412040 [compost metagenome]